MGLAVNAFLVYLEPSERALVAANVVPPPTHWGAKSAPSNPLAESDRPLHGGKKKGRKGRKEGKGKKNIPLKYISA